MAPRLKMEFVPDPWPNFTDAQVEFLESRFPARCLAQHESVEDHLRYAGKVDLIAQLRDHVIGSPSSLALTDEEEEALDDMSVAIALDNNKKD